MTYVLFTGSPVALETYLGTLGVFATLNVVPTFERTTYLIIYS